MAFARQDTGKWREDIPGARWFKADLHIHTVDRGDKAFQLRRKKYGF